MPTNEEIEIRAAWDQSLQDILKERLSEDPTDTLADVNMDELFEKYPNSVDAAEFLIATYDLEETDYEDNDDNDDDDDDDDDEQDDDEDDDDEDYQDPDDRKL